MLRVILELVPGGREDKKRVIGVMEICNQGGGVVSDYKVRGGAHFEEVKEGVVKAYPRWSESIWGLVGRSCARLVNESDTSLGKKPKEVGIPEGGVIDLDSLPEVMGRAFDSALYGSTCPYVEGKNLAYTWDFKAFLTGSKNPRVLPDFVLKSGEK